MTDVERANYGLDAPVLLRRFAVLGTLALIAGTVGPRLLANPPAGFVHVLFVALVALGGWLVFCAVVMVWGSRGGKLRLRDQLLGSIPWRGDETVLDVGCGHGLLLIGVAKRLTTGRVVGIDVWSCVDQAENSQAATEANARVEGVSDRVTVRDGDARRLDFPDASFDAVVSSLALHNIPTKAERTEAIREIVRVLEPGGHLAIVDIWRVTEYARVLRECGMRDVRMRFPSFHFVVPSILLTAQKPGGDA